MKTYKNPDIIAFRAAWQQLQPEGYQGLEPVDLFRTAFDEQHGAIPVAEGCTVDAVEFAGCKGERLTPAAGGGNGVLLYLHGGGHVFGSARSHRHMVSRIAEAANMIAYLPDHRLAPENPYPAGLDDAHAFHAAVRALHPSARFVIGGESAGGNLAAALVLRLAAEKAALPDAVYLLSPWLDMTQSGASMDLLGGSDLMISRRSLDDCAAYYAGTHDRSDPLLSPLFGDLADFPPLLIQASSDEVLLSDSLRFAERTALAGGEVELQIWPEMVHAWPLFHPAIGVASDTMARAGRWISGTE